MNESKVPLNIPDTTLVTFRPPQGKEVLVSPDGRGQQVDVSSIIRLFRNEFVFRESSVDPGRLLVKIAEVNKPPGAGAFFMLSGIQASFTTPDFQFLTGRPLGQVYAELLFRERNNPDELDKFVCRVRLTDTEEETPIEVRVTGTVVFYN